MSGVTITDLVGNIADVDLNDSPVVLHVDQAPPMITIIEPPAEQLSAQENYNNLYVEFIVSRLLAETPVITISNSNFNEPCAYNGTRYVCDFFN